MKAPFSWRRWLLCDVIGWHDKHAVKTVDGFTVWCNRCGKCLLGWPA